MSYYCCLPPQFMTIIDPNPLFNNNIPLRVDDNFNDTQPFLITTQIPNTIINYQYQNSPNNCAASNNLIDFSESEKNYNYQPLAKNMNYTEYAKNINSCSTSTANMSYNQRRKFTPEEDENLKKIIAIYGPMKWDKVALLMPGRTGRQCRDRFHNYLSPTLVNGPWTKEEDEILEQKVLEYGQHWNKIAPFFKGRSDNNIKNRWHTYISRHRQFKNEELLNSNCNNNIDEKTDNEASDEYDKIDYIKNFVDEKNNDNNNQNNSSNNYLNDSNASDSSTNENDIIKKSLKNNFDVIPIRSNTNGKKILFPPICPPGESTLFSMNHGGFNFLSQILAH